MKRLLQSTLVFLTILCALGAARAQTPQSPIVITGPTTITQSGYYILGNNISVTGSSAQTILTVNANNVTLDFNGFYIAGPAVNTQAVTGVSANEKSNLTVKNGTIAYCSTGIDINGNDAANTNNVGHRIQNMRITYCYHYGIFFEANSPGSQVSQCQFSQIGGAASASFTIAVYAFGGGVTESDNSISTVTRPANNSGSASSYGIYNGIGSFALRNTISNCDFGVDNGKYQGNLTASVNTPFEAGTDAGNNN